MADNGNFLQGKADIMRNIASNYYLNPTLVTFAHKTLILNGFEAETSVFLINFAVFFHLYRNKSLPSIDDFWSILKIIHWAFIFTWVCGGSRRRTEVIWHLRQAPEKKHTHPKIPSSGDPIRHFILSKRRVNTPVFILFENPVTLKLLKKHRI